MVDLGNVRMYPREAAVYWIQKPKGEKDLLIFDAGHSEGDVYVYEHKKTVPVKTMVEEMKAHYQKDELPRETLQAIVGLWINKNFGYAIDWKLVK